MPTKRKPTIGTYITSARIEARYLSKKINKIKRFMQANAKLVALRQELAELEARFNLSR